MKKTLWIDVETTGLDDEKDSIIEIAAIFQHGENDLEQTFHRYVLPQFTRLEDWDSIEKLTGISWEYLQNNGITEEQCYREFISFCSNLVNRYDKTDKMIIAGYNPKFDNGFIRQLFKRNYNDYFGSYFFSCNVDVLSDVGKALRKGLIPILPSFSLSSICEHFGIEFKAHSALEDINATINLSIKLEDCIEKFNDARYNK